MGKRPLSELPWCLESLKIGGNVKNCFTKPLPTAAKTRLAIQNKMSAEWLPSMAADVSLPPSLDTVKPGGAYLTHSGGNRSNAMVMI